jgi:hypothetical protein
MLIKYATATTIATTAEANANASTSGPSFANGWEYNY